MTSEKIILDLVEQYLKVRENQPLPMEEDPKFDYSMLTEEEVKTRKDAREEENKEKRDKEEEERKTRLDAIDASAGFK